MLWRYTPKIPASISWVTGISDVSLLSIAVNNQRAHRCSNECSRLHVTTGPAQ